MELPNIPGNSPSNDSGDIRSNQLTRKNLKSILHLITGELKKRGTKTPHIFLPFRSKIDDYRLEKFLTSLFPSGELLKDETLVLNILKSFDEFTMICGLKYLWSRLPNNEVIGWDVYLEYKRKEKEAGYPKVAFLSIMPKCLSSPAHASIVYDFLDLLISVASNSQYNYLSGRKIAKMSSVWAFNTNRSGQGQMKSAFYDATIVKENNFIDGLNSWQESTDAIFHLLLSFLRAMLPENEMETLKLPKTLQSLLITNNYPPIANTDSIKSIITIPCVSVRSTKVSSTPYELISKVRHVLSFDKKDSFVSIENYTILKSIFEKNSTSDIVSSLTEESRRVLSRLTEDPISSRFGLYPGWSKVQERSIKPDPNIPLYSEITIKNVSIQDYYIWAWLSSLASDQPSSKKTLFGRSLVVEAGLRGFQKWLILTEEVMSTEEYLNKFKSGSNIVPKVPEKEGKRAISNESYKDMPLPPPPPPPTKGKNSGLLPTYTFDNGSLALEVNEEHMDYRSDEDYGHHEELNDYTQYLKSLSLSDENLGQHINSKVGDSSPSLDSKRNRPPPPQMDQVPPSSHTQSPYYNGQVYANEPVPPQAPVSREYTEPYSVYETKEDIAAKNLSQQAQDPYAHYFVPGTEAQSHVNEEPKYIPAGEIQTLEPQTISDLAPPAETVVDPELPYEPVAEPELPYDNNKENEEVKKKKKKKKDKEKEKKRTSQLPFPFPPGAVPPGMMPPFMDAHGNMEGMPPMGFFPLPPGMTPKDLSPKSKEKKKKKKRSSTSPEASPKQPVIPKFEITPVSPQANNSSPVLESTPVLPQPGSSVPAQQRVSPPPVMQQRASPPPVIQHQSVPKKSPRVNGGPQLQKPQPQIPSQDLEPATQPPQSYQTNQSSFGQPVKKVTSPDHVAQAPPGQAARSHAQMAGAPHQRSEPSQSPARAQGNHSHSPGRGQPGYGQYGAGPAQAHPAQAPHGQAPHGQAPHGQAPHGQAPHGQAPHGQAPHGQAPHGQNPSQAPQQPYQYPPQGYYPPPQGYPYYPPPQGYYPPPQGYAPPAQGYAPAPQGYPPPQAYPYYPPPGSANPPAEDKRGRTTTSDIAMMGMPPASRHNKNRQANKANLRNAFVQGSFGI
ncbi:multicopy suppressor of a budding defect [Yamadazyma tenuis]|uniref:multicopy suppressor of a budding defect n=1 Tax=Candida tenuis TaxID=2315449 RepID=UPI00279E5832|nr:multicopy suppressor of a budding defect [Yamadazyma tenuis]